MIKGVMQQSRLFMKKYPIQDIFHRMACQDESLFLAVWDICSTHEKHCVAININSAENTLAEVIVRYCTGQTLIRFWKSISQRTRRSLLSVETEEGTSLIDLMIAHQDQHVAKQKTKEIV